MNIVTEDIFDVKDPGRTMVVATTCGIVLRSNPRRLVMGKGSAKALVERHPLAPYWAAQSILVSSNTSHEKRQSFLYGFIPLLVPTHLETAKTPMCGIGIFQTKMHFNRPSVLSIIEMSVRELVDFLQKHEYSVRLAFPGIGNGNLTEKEVLPFLKPLEQFDVTLCKEPK